MREEKFMPSLFMYLCVLYLSIYLHTYVYCFERSLNIETRHDVYRLSLVFYSPYDPILSTEETFIYIDIYQHMHVTLAFWLIENRLECVYKQQEEALACGPSSLSTWQVHLSFFHFAPPLWILAFLIEVPAVV